MALLDKLGTVAGSRLDDLCDIAQRLPFLAGTKSKLAAVPQF